VSDVKTRETLLVKWKEAYANEVFDSILSEINRMGAIGAAAHSKGPAALTLYEDTIITLLSTAAAAPLSAPFEITSLLLQTEPELMRRGTLMPWDAFAGPIDCFRRRVLVPTVVSTLWKSAFLQVVSTVPQKAVDAAAAAVLNFRPLQSLVAVSWLPQQAGALGRLVLQGCVTQAAVHPLEVVRTRIACGQKGTSGPLLSTFSPTFALLSSALVAQANLSYSSYIQSRQQDGRELGWELACLNTAKDIGIRVALYPIEVVIRRMMLAPADAQYSGVWDCAGSVAASEGATGFVKGISACVVEAAITSVVVTFMDRALRRWYAGVKARRWEVQTNQMRLQRAAQLQRARQQHAQSPPQREQ